MDLHNLPSDPGEVYDLLRAQAHPGLHYERELTEFYDRLDRDPSIRRMW
jgi:hypothetical protein